MPSFRYPSNSEHVFAKPDAAWTKTVSRLKLRPDSFIVVPPTEPDFEGCWTNTEYRMPENHDWKMQRRDPEGRLRLEIDTIGEDSYSCEFFSNGTLSGYEHRRGRKWVGAVSFDISGNEIARIEDGSGELIAKNSHDFVHDGKLYLCTVSENAKVREIHLLDHDTFKIDLIAKTEELTLSGEAAPNGQWTPGERWTKSNGAKPYLYIDLEYMDADTGKTCSYFMDEKTQRRKKELAENDMGYAGSGTPESQRREEQRRAVEAEARADLRVPEYAKVRAAFVERYMKLLGQIGADPAKLGLVEALKVVE